MNTLNSKDLQITVKKTEAVNINCPVPFLKHVDRRQQSLLIDEPNEIYYNPSTKTLHADNFSGGIPSLVEGEAIELTTQNNSTEIDVNFTKNTEVVTEILDNDTFLLSNTSNNLKTITGEKLKEDIRLTAGDNLEYGTGVNSNKLSLKTALTNTSLNTGTTWNGNLIVATKLSDGSVSDTEFQKLNGITSAILQTSDKNTANGVCGLDSNGIILNAQLPSSVNDIIEVANFSALPNTGESSKIYVTLDNHKAYRWSGTSYVEISASLVLGTTSGTAYDGASGQANADNIALKQPILVDSATSGILIDGNNNIDIDMTRTTAETTFDDNELMLIQKTNGDLCRLTKQQLKSSINTNTEYNSGANITVDSSNDINLNDNISTNSAELRTDLVLKVASGSVNNTDYINNIIFQNTGNFKTIALTRRYNSNMTTNTANFCIQNGTGATITDPSHPIRLCVRSTGEVNIGSSQTKTHGFNVEGTSNFENTVTVNSIESSINTDLKIESNGTGNILLIASPNTSTIGYIHLARADDTSQRFNTIAYNTDGNNSYINFLVHYTAGSNNLTRQVLKLNSDLSADFAADVNIPTGSNYKIGGVNLPTSNTEYLLGNNLSFDTSTNPDTINMDNDLTSINSITSQATSDLTIAAGASTAFYDKIIFKTNDVERAYINHLDMDLSVNLNIPNDKHYQIDGEDVLHNTSTTSAKNITLNCRVIQNLSSAVLDGLFINYMTTSSANAHCRFYSGGSSTIRMFIEGDGKVGVNCVDPTEQFEVNGNINITDGNDYKINGTAIIHSYINGTNITIASDKSINLNSPLTGISGIQNTSDTVFTRNSVQICKVGVNGFEMLNSKKFIGDIEGPIKPYIIRDTNDYDQPIVSYRALSSSVTQLPPNQLQLILPDSSNIITINHSTGLLKTKNIYIDGTITNASSITATQFVGSLSGNATTVSNGIYLNNTGNQSIVGSLACAGIVSKANKAQAEALAQNSSHGSGTLAFGVGSTSTDKFDVYFYMKSNVTSQDVYGSFSATVFGSDDRRKHNEIPIENALDSIMKLQCETYQKTFVFKDENWNGNLEDEAHWLESGLIAQDVYKIPEFKDYVKVGNDTISWDINYNCIFTYNIRATQQLKIGQDKLKLENDKLKNEVIELKKTNKNLIDKMYELEMKMELILKNLNLATL